MARNHYQYAFTIVPARLGLVVFNANKFEAHATAAGAREYVRY